MIAKITSFNLQVIHLDIVTNMEGRKTGGGGGVDQTLRCYFPFRSGNFGHRGLPNEYCAPSGRNSVQMSGCGSGQSVERALAPEQGSSRPYGTRKREPAAVPGLRYAPSGAIFDPPYREGRSI